jgi:predicted nucleic acid-binding protein
LSPIRDVILDADFLSAFLKIDRLSLVKEFYQVEVLFVPPAVYNEVSLIDLLSSRVNIPWLQIRPPDSASVQALRRHEEFTKLGPGEQEAIALSYAKKNSVLLMNDNRARQMAARLGIEVLNIPAFLSACKLSGLLSRVDIAALIEAVEKRDRYGFRKDVRDLLLS